MEQVPLKYKNELQCKAFKIIQENTWMTINEIVMNFASLISKIIELDYNKWIIHLCPQKFVKDLSIKCWGISWEDLIPIDRKFKTCN